MSGSTQFIPLSETAEILNPLAKEHVGRDLRIIAESHVAETLVGGSIEYARTLASMISNKGGSHARFNAHLYNAVDDIGQDTGAMVFNKFGMYQGDSRFTTWLHRCVINRTIVFNRSHAGKSMLFSDVVGDKISPFLEATDDNFITDPVDRANQKEMWEIYHRAKQGLSEKHLAVLELDEEGLSYLEMAEALQIPINTVRSRLSRARGSLADMIEQMYPNEWFSTLLAEANRRKR